LYFVGRYWCSGIELGVVKNPNWNWRETRISRGSWCASEELELELKEKWTWRWTGNCFLELEPVRKHDEFELRIGGNANWREHELEGTRIVSRAGVAR